MRAPDRAPLSLRIRYDMAAEPIMLFARGAESAAVARKLRELSPKVHVDRTDADWRRAVVTTGGLLRKRVIAFNYSPEYHAEPNWSTQMGGMRGYLARFPQTERAARAVMLPTTFRWALSVELTPELAGDGAGDPRLEVLYAVAEMLDGVLFTPSSLRDARGRVLFGAGGEAEEDPDAAWPRVIAQVAVQPSTEAEEDDEEYAPDPPSAERVARRALALTAVSVRGLLEQDTEDAGARRMHRDLLAWVEQGGVTSELEAYELALIQQPLGELDPRAQLNASWRLEGLAVLVWALGLADLPPHDALVEPDALWTPMRLMDAGGARTLVADAALRPREEIEGLRSRLFALHWRLRDYGINGRSMDFAAFARTAWFGPLDIAGVPLVDGDLAIGGRRIDRADRDDLGRAHSAAQERHLAANWLCDGPALYSDADAST